MVAGPSEASCTTALGCVKPTTVVSTKLNNGSDNQMSIVVDEKTNSVRYEGTRSLLESVSVSVSVLLVLSVLESVSKLASLAVTISDSDALLLLEDKVLEDKELASFPSSLVAPVMSLLLLLPSLS